MFARLNRPWLHFLLIGTALFYLQRWLDPVPPPSVGPLADSQVESLRRQWFTTTGQMPAPDQLEAMVAAELDREMLFQEALVLELHRYDEVVRQRLVRNMHFLRLAEGRSEEELYREALRMELHLGDEVVKRRLIQIMEQILLARQAPVAVDEQAISEAFGQRRQELMRPPRYSIEQVFLSRERAAEAELLLQQIEAQDLSAEAARQFSSPFLPGYRFAAQSPAQLARNFGAAFVLNLEAAAPRPQTWVGPIESTYGSHLVWIDAMEAAREARLEEVSDQLRRDLELQYKREALREAVAELRQRYEVIL
ncbi:MAG: peptidylprolyl isomerase [Halieaceae bacterium]